MPEVVAGVVVAGIAAAGLFQVVTGIDQSGLIDTITRTGIPGAFIWLLWMTQRREQAREEASIKREADLHRALDESRKIAASQDETIRRTAEQLGRITDQIGSLARSLQAIEAEVQKSGRLRRWEGDE